MNISQGMRFNPKVKLHDILDFIKNYSRSTGETMNFDAPVVLNVNGKRYDANLVIYEPDTNGQFCLTLYSKEA